MCCHRSQDHLSPDVKPTAEPLGAALPRDSTWGFAGTPTLFTGGLWKTQGPFSPERPPLVLREALLGIGGF